MKLDMSGLQQLGRALMLPIAVLPAAGLLLRLGQPDMLDIAFIAAAGQALFANLGLLFAIGVAVGFAKEGHGAAGLAGVVCYFVTTFGAKVFVGVPPEALAGVPEAYAGLVADSARDSALSRLSVPIGILSGLTGGLLYNRFHAIKLPDYLAFFGGRRFVPIASAGVGMLLAAGIGVGIDALNTAVEAMSAAVLDAGGFGLFIYGALNRLLIVTGLHHVLNNLAWFVVGDFEGATGDLNRFFAGDPTAGGFMAGFFPVMMFGLPAACLAMYMQARKENRAEVGGMLGSLALTSFLTGVTEPVEFTFMFLAPVLYALHAVLTGISMALMDWLNIKLGFGFSAGLFDYVINFQAATNPWLMIPVGLVYGGIYYAIFTVAIRTFNLATPGRGEQAAVSTAPAVSADDEGLAYLRALGGADNLNEVGACTTRLRMQIRDGGAIDEAALRALGAKGFVRPSEKTLQVVIGPTAELVSDKIRQAMGEAALSATETPSAQAAPLVLPKDVSEAFGGSANLKAAAMAAGNRLLVSLADAERVSTEKLQVLGLVPASGDGFGANRHYLVSSPALLVRLNS